MDQTQQLNRSRGVCLRFRSDINGTIEFAKGDESTDVGSDCLRNQLEQRDASIIDRHETCSKLRSTTLGDVII